MKLSVPYYSQFKDVTREEFKPGGDGRACFVTCLKMALEYMRGVPAPDVDTLFDEALIIQKDMLQRNLITPDSVKHGLPHDILVFVAHNRGITAHKEEFKSVGVNTTGATFTESPFSEEMLLKGINKLIRTLREKGLVIVSVPPGFSTNKTVHTILLIGFEEKDGVVSGFFFHNPDDRNGNGRDEFISLEDFKKTWRRLAIFF